MLAFVLVNWKSLWFLVFADQSVMAKFAFIDAQTDVISLLIKPVVIGTIFALASPYINWGAAILVSKAVTGHRLMQIDEQKKLAVSRRELAASLKETAVEEKQAATARVEALEKTKIADDVSTDKQKDDEMRAREEVENLSEIELICLVHLGLSNQPLVSAFDLRDNFALFDALMPFFPEQRNRITSAIVLALEKFEVRGIVRPSIVESIKSYSLTLFGTKVFANAIRLHPNLPHKS